MSRPVVALVAATALVAVVVCAGVGMAAGATTWDVYTGEGTPIQDAIDDADPGDTIHVHAGTYVENVDADKERLTLIGDGADVVTVRAADAGDHVFEVTEGWLNVSGFTVDGANGSWLAAGIYLGSGVDHCNISDNNASNNNCGIYLNSSSNNTLSDNVVSGNYYGISIGYSNNNSFNNNTLADNEYYGISSVYSNNNNLIDNTVSSNGGSIWLEFSSNNRLTDNTVSDNKFGIVLCYSSNNTLTGNIMSENEYNYCILGDNLSHFIQNINMSNTVDGKPVYYWVDQQNKSVPDDAGFVGIVNSTNVTVNDLKLANNTIGVLFAYTNNSRIKNVTTSNNDCGIRLVASSHNNLTGNTASGNDFGIDLSSSINNTLAGNTASNNYCGIRLSYSSHNNIITGNTASGNDCGIDLSSSSNNTVTENTVNSNNDGVCLHSSSNNTLNGNTASNNDHGIHLYFSNNNTLSNNIVNSNNNGIYLQSSSGDNTIYHNNPINNTNYNAHDEHTNVWDSGYSGNHYSDYIGADNNTDGIGDTPHPIPGGVSTDRFPLMQPWAGDTPKRGDLNGDNQITFADVAIALQLAAGGFASCDPATLAAADVSCDNRVTSLDALLIMRLAAGAIEL